MKSFATTLLCLVLASGPASAQGVNLHWNDCGGGTGAAINKTFACDTNVGDPFTMFVSVVPGVEMPQFVAVEARIDVLVASASLPPWWQMASGQCRAGALGVTCDPIEFGTLACADIWDGAQPLSAYQVTTAPVPYAFRLQFGAALAAPAAITAGELGEELVLGAMRITRAKTTGPGSCDGCLVGACFIVEQVKLMQPAGVGDFVIASPATNNWVQFNGGIGWWNCYVPNVNRTWGSIKTLYR